MIIHQKNSIIKSIIVCIFVIEKNYVTYIFIYTNNIFKNIVRKYSHQSTDEAPDWNFVYRVLKRPTRFDFETPPYKIAVIYGDHFRRGIISEGSKIEPHDTERRQSLRCLYAWSSQNFQKFQNFYPEGGPKYGDKKCSNYAEWTLEEKKNLKSARKNVSLLEAVRDFRPKSTRQ